MLAIVFNTHYSYVSVVSICVGTCKVLKIFTEFHATTDALIYI